MVGTYSQTGKEREGSFFQSRIPEDATFIDLDDLESEASDEEPTEAHLRNRHDNRRFRLQDIYARPELHRNRPENNNSVIRNPPITAPLKLLLSFDFKDRKLWPGKTTVELGTGEFSGEFLRITQIIENESTREVFLRGQRFRRNRAMKHMLINKLNEVCLCIEVDLDDPRPTEEQSAVEVPLSEVLTIRRLNFTNMNYPLGQEHGRVVLEQGLSPKLKQKKVEAEGLLLCRWKSSTFFASAADRAKNKFISDELVRLSTSEITIEDRRVLETDARFEWRGETVLGGSCRPALPQAKVTVSSSSTKRKRFFTEQAIPRKNSTPVTPKPIIWQLATPPSSSRALVEHINFTSSNAPQRHLSARPLSTHSIGGPYKSFRGRGPLFGPTTSSARSSVSLSSMPKIPQRLVQSSTTVPRGISPFTSSLSTPPPSGVVLSRSALSTKITRLLGQRYTYGDAFCGSGGATRGAKLAGLKVIWGLDFDTTACASWRANFTEAECFQMAAHDFIVEANASEARRKAIQVDVLHCSCPCQYYSPAHTRAGQHDEMNTASLFASSELIKVVKPRIVTFEQTFGIMTYDHRGYFRSLIHMLTELNFSVRWEVVQFQNWVCLIPP
jgi:DNA (cytosine-5)-methyltransferase 1